jgi:hypothetical protein
MKPMRKVPKTDFHDMVAEMANIPRKQAKTISLGIMYGMGAGKLSEQLDIPLDEAKSLIKQYHDRVPFVKGLMVGVMNHLNDKSSSGSLSPHSESMKPPLFQSTSGKFLLNDPQKPFTPEKEGGE